MEIEQTKNQTNIYVFDPMFKVSEKTHITSITNYSSTVSFCVLQYDTLSTGEEHETVLVMPLMHVKFDSKV